MTRRLKLSRALLTGAAALVLAGCQLADLAPPVPTFAPANVAALPQLPAHLRRVVVLPVHGGAIAPEEAAVALDPVIVAALQKQARFEVVVLSRAECRREFGVADFSSAAALPPDLLARLAQAHGADGVLFTDLTAYRAHRPIEIGLRLKLATTADVRIVWACDEVFSAEDPAVAAGVRRHYRGSVGAAPVDLTPAALQSPARFGAYAAETAFRTLPPR